MSTGMNNLHITTITDSRILEAHEFQAEHKNRA